MAEARRRRVPRRRPGRARRRAARQGGQAQAAADERRRLRRHPGQGRRALPRRRCSPRCSRQEPGRRGAGHRLGLERRLAGDRARGRRRACSRSRRAAFGHGRTRNLGAERTSGELICFLTQDATPLPGWLAAFREAFALDGRRRRRVRPAPAAARHVADDRARADRVLRRLRARRRPGAPARGRRAVPLQRQRLLPARRAGRRSASTTSPTPRTRRSARAMLAAGWAKAYHPGAAVLHAHDYPPVGLHAPLLRRVPRAARDRAATSSGSACARRRATCAALVARRPALDARAGHGAARARRAGPARSARPPRRAQGVLRARLARRPAARRRSQRAISLEGRATAGPPAAAPGPGAVPEHRDARRPDVCGRRRPRSSATARRRCSTRCRGWRTPSGCTSRSSIPPFRRGSGGHSTIYNLLTRLEERGHTVTTWLHDPVGYMQRDLAGGRPRRPARVLPADRGPGVQGLRRSGTAPTSCSPRAGTRSTPVLRLDQVPRPRLPRPGPRARVLRHLGRVAVGARDLHARACTASPPGPWLRDLLATPLRRAPRARSTSASTTTSTARARSTRRERHDHLLRARTSRRGAPCRSACWRWRSSTAAGRTRASCCSATTTARRAVPVRAPRRRLAGGARLGVLGGDRRPLALADELLADPAGDAGLRPAVRRARRATTSSACSARTARLELARARPGRARRRAASALLDDPALRARRARRGARVRRRQDLGPRRRPARGRPARRAARRALRAARRAAPPRTPAGAASASRNARAVAVGPARRRAGDGAAVRAAGRGGRRRRARAARRGAGAGTGSTSADTTRSSRCVFGVWHAVPAVLEKTGLSPAAAARGRPRDGARPARRRRRALLRRHASPRRSARVGADLGEVAPRAGLRLLVGTRSSARSPRPGRRPSGTAATRTRDAIAWAREHLPGIAFDALAAGPAAALRRRRLRLRRARSRSGRTTASRPRIALARRDAPRDPPRRAAACSPRTACSRSPTTRAPASAPPASSTAIRARAVPHGLLVRATSSATDGDWGVRHPQWGTAFFTPEWLLARALPALVVEDFAVGRNADNQDVYVLRRR